MTKNKLIEQENKFIDVLVSMKAKIGQLNQEFAERIKVFSERKIPEERHHFWCDGCNQRIKLDERFIKFEIWRNHVHMWNDLIAETFEVYHTKCWYDGKLKTALNSNSEPDGSTHNKD